MVTGGCDPAYRGRTMREAQNDCSGFPAHRNNKTSRVGEDWPQIHCAGMSARSPGWQGGAVQAPARRAEIQKGEVRHFFLVYCDLRKY